MSTATTTRIPSAATPAPWFGRAGDHRHAVVAGAGSLFACALYWLAARQFAPEFTPGPLEFAGTATSLWSVWITQRRNVLALPIGIISVVLMGQFFASIDLAGQQWLHWGYYLPVQLVAWWQWTRGGEGGGELDVTRLQLRGRVVVLVAWLALTLLVTAALFAAAAKPWIAGWDASIVAASVVAMVLLARKKVESWWLWIAPVNISAIGLYLTTGAFMFSALYVLFLVMAVVGLARWNRAAAARQP